MNSQASKFGEKSFRDMAHRIDVAERDFIKTLMTFGDISESDAKKVFAFYRKLKVLKNQYAVSRISVKHGAFLDKETIRRAINA